MLTFSSKPRGIRARRSPTHAEPGAGLAPLSQLQSRAVAEPIDYEAPEDEVALKGWHDSSGELKRGLDVTENVPLDTLPADLRADFTPRRR